MTNRGIIHPWRGRNRDIIGYEPVEGSAMVPTLEDATRWHEERGSCAILRGGDIHWCAVHSSTFSEEEERCWRANGVSERTEQAYLEAIEAMDRERRQAHDFND